MRNTIFLLLMLVSGWSTAEFKQDGASTATSIPAQTKYEKVISICNVVATAGNPEAENFNWVSPATIAIAALGESFNHNDQTQWNHLNSTMQVTLLAGPWHGTLVPSPKDYSYRANEGYTGMDQMVFEVKLDGKTYKGIYSVYVTPGAPDNYSGCTEDGPYTTPEGNDPDEPSASTTIMELPITDTKAPTSSIKQNQHN